jgi:CRISPR-associated protein Cas1
MIEQQILGCLYVMTPRAYLSVDHDSVRVELEDMPAHRIPLMGIDAIVASALRAVSGGLIERLTLSGRSLTFLDGRGRFMGRIVGPMAGNVLLRVAQHRAAEESTALGIARSIVLAKVQNQRRLIQRRARDAREPGRMRLDAAATGLATTIATASVVGSLDELRGHEGDAARRYFAVFSEMVTAPGREFALQARERRPPRGRMNALLSFLYTMATHEAVAAAESVGLDPQLGYLHALRPGRPALALDLVEEVRAPLCDRLALSLVNRRQLAASDFVLSAGGAVYLTESGRRIVSRAWAERRQETVRHPLLHEQLPWGLVLHAQARLLARHLRGELASYPAFLAPA